MSSALTRLTSSVGSVEITANAFKATGRAGFVRLKVTRKSTSLNGYVRIAGILQCGSTNRNILYPQVRPGITTPWERELTCPNTEIPVVFLADVSLWPN